MDGLHRTGRSQQLTPSRRVRRGCARGCASALTRTSGFERKTWYTSFRNARTRRKKPRRVARQDRKPPQRTPGSNSQILWIKGGSRPPAPGRPPPIAGSHIPRPQSRLDQRALHRTGPRLLIGRISWAVSPVVTTSLMVRERIPCDNRVVRHDRGDGGSRLRGPARASSAHANGRRAAGGGRPRPPEFWSSSTARTIGLHARVLQSSGQQTTGGGHTHGARSRRVARAATSRIRRARRAPLSARRPV